MQGSLSEKEQDKNTDMTTIIETLKKQMYTMLKNTSTILTYHKTKLHCLEISWADLGWHINT